VAIPPTADFLDYLLYFTLQWHGLQGQQGEGRSAAKLIMCIFGPCFLGDALVMHVLLIITVSVLSLILILLGCWDVIKEVAIPPTADSLDYSGMAFRGSKVRGAAVCQGVFSMCYNIPEASGNIEDFLQE
jgi:hypothetical protein